MRQSLLVVVLVLLIAPLLLAQSKLDLSPTNAQAHSSQPIQAGVVPGSAVPSGLTPAPSPTCPPAWGIVNSPNPSVGTNYLFAVDAVSSSDAWAVGYYGGGGRGLTLALHWDGSQWTHVPSPSPGTDLNPLIDVDAFSYSDVWAVGYRYTEGMGRLTLTEHWDGNQWTTIPSPNVVTTQNYLYSVSAVSTNDVWAVGYYVANIGGFGVGRTLIEHWDGSQWSVVPSPNVNNEGNGLYAVSGISPNDVWAVGSYTLFEGGSRTLIQHWDGNQWSVVPSPNPPGGFRVLLQGVAAISANDVWAVGVYQNGPGPGYTLVEHWDGSQWSIVPSPNAGPDYSDLQAVSASSPTNVWAVGYYCCETNRGATTLIEHWDGTEWSLVSSLSPSFVNHLRGVAAISENDVWAAGYSYDCLVCEINTLIEHYAPSAPCLTSTPTVTPQATPLSPTSTLISTSTRTPTASVNPSNSTTGTATTTTTPARTLTNTPAATPTAVHCAFPDFAPAAYYSVEGQPSFVAVRDLDDDSHPDIVTANTLSNTISVLLNNGDGTFQAAVDYSVGGGPTSVVTGDFSGDDHEDIAVANSYSNSVSVLLGNGDGTFQAAVSYPVGQAPLSTAVGDFSRDGHLDLAVANGAYPNTVSVLLNSGNGTFQAAVDYPVMGGGRSLVVGDLDRDGHLDLTTTGGGENFGRVSVLLGNGDGTFREGTSFVVQGAIAGAASGDFNRDGHLDLAAAVFSGFPDGGVLVMLNNGDGTFGPATFYSVESNFATHVVVGDFNGDGRQDLATSNNYPDRVWVLLGNGDGTFGVPTNYAAGDYPSSIAVGDFNSDGRLDVAVADRGSWPNYQEGVSVLLNSCESICSTVFPDVRPSDYFYQAVTYLACRGVVTGYSDGTFRPFNNTTRGQLTKIVILGFGLPLYTPPTPTFTDVPTAHTFYPYIETAAHEGLVSGYSDSTFRPENNVTRGQLSKIVVEAAGWALLNPPTPTFSDVPPLSPFYQHIETAYSHSIISGYADGSFRPGNNATRGQIAKIVHNAITAP